MNGTYYEMKKKASIGDILIWARQRKFVITLTKENIDNLSVCYDDGVEVMKDLLEHSGWEIIKVGESMDVSPLAHEEMGHFTIDNAFDKIVDYSIYNTWKFVGIVFVILGLLKWYFEF